MIRIERPAIAITATHVGLALALALATAVFLDLAVVHRTQISQVGFTSPAANDMIDEPGLGLASWDCADVPITVQCGGTEAKPAKDVGIRLGRPYPY